MTRRVPTVLAAVVSAGLLAGCTPDATRARLEPDVATTFAQALDLSRHLQDAAAAPATVTSTECHNVTDPVKDAGPGTWQCNLDYTRSGRTRSVTLAVTVDNLGCYAAVDTGRRDAVITDTDTGGETADPAAAFDGCFEVG